MSVGWISVAVAVVGALSRSLSTIGRRGAFVWVLAPLGQHGDRGGGIDVVGFANVGENPDVLESIFGADLSDLLRGFGEREELGKA